MKRTIQLFALLLVAGVTTVNAQVPVSIPLPNFDLGVKVGANFDQLNGGTWQQAYKPGILAGAFFGIRKNKIGVQIEGLVNTAKYSVKDVTTKTDIKAVYLDIPLMFEYKILPFLWAQAGPEYSGLISVTSTNDAITDAKSLFKSGGAAGVIGLELKLPVKLVAGVRYVLGFTDMDNKDKTGITEAWQRRTIQLHVGFSFL